MALRAGVEAACWAHASLSREACCAVDLVWGLDADEEQVVTRNYELTSKIEGLFNNFCFPRFNNLLTKFCQILFLKTSGLSAK